MNEIIPYVWVGDVNDGRRAHEQGYAVLSVMWDGEPMNTGPWTRIATTDFEQFQEYAGRIIQAGAVCADPVKMDLAADWIHERVVAQQPVLVHCAYGIERSPLTVVWYLMRYHGHNLKTAYDVVLTQRPAAQYRGAWMPASVRLDGVLPEKITKKI